MARGTIQNKETFLTNIADQLGRKRKTEGVERPQWSKSPQHDVFAGMSQDEMLDRFVLQCDKIHTNVVVIPQKDLASSFERVVSDMGSGSIVHWNDPRFETYGLKETLKKQEDAGVDVFEWNPDLGHKNIEKAEQANIGVTFSDTTLAESGTVVLHSNAGKGRSVSLLPQRYIAIIPKSTLVPRMTQAAEKLHELADENGRTPSCVNFISGPSNSADIELRLVVGVHGPVQATYIVIDDQ
ncbi:LutC/YkgG family protein [Salisediminibacterium halotolerans]|uniref:Lactate utilization protein C n=1 Tax=Salisediminibacterium halotolerans TaxID=517425 RepID=A0A1H9VAP9_9BACI|nr:MULTISPECIES: lactate utilization protein C [Salisediminibacterium]RLJ78370.1 L-lactate dehydrogenase complex protein LldG [Actinophytocola xinjiangensis]RPE88288.1 L-lactate dehydrogenase complex protein LldG [Salisediminibacterium halotolerans]TWG37346.1 L-lactate dehydrogenase complex protein LldG [Salisediminibacterium halotolerans]SES18762.1 L-lactate dehydrogenase complex protein LldG [Salisediminibacterium haloalkalitolerans]GEL06811.1 lactate utilization protein C [Salisediminibacte